MPTQMRTEKMKIKPISYAEIDLRQLARNYQLIRGALSPSTKMAAVVKADAYGHGAVQTARTALEAGASYLVVARLNEALALRESGIEAPILLLGSLLPENTAQAAAGKITLSINGTEDAENYSRRLNSLPLKVHLKVDTGMGRLGMRFHNVEADASTALQIVKTVSSLPGIEIEGMYTHFASADAAADDLQSCRNQFERFKALIQLLEANGLRPPLCHCANSAATLRFPQMHLDMCRVGIIQYGLSPSEEMRGCCLDLKPVMSLKTHIIHLKEVSAGEAISYGSTWKASRPSRIATVAVGYADGYQRALSNRGEMLVNGKRVPVVGRVCMDLTMLDVSEVPEAAVGSTVTVWGFDGESLLSADEVADRVRTIGYELTSGVSPRIERIYKR